MSEIANILRWGRSIALMRLRDKPLPVWRAVLDAELRRPRPRKLLVKALRQRIAQQACADPSGDYDARQMTDWSQITAAQWRKLTDRELAEIHGVTPAAVGAARARHNAPPSPAGHGGARPGSGIKLVGDDDEPTTMTLQLTKGQKRKLMQAHKTAGATLNEWAVKKLMRGLE
ncbi:MAG: hypothetical protein JNJ83_10860 [Verrucomicrobiaceae bacterium]|nr:hypothetical protein [Verrucomicrobiaceae bacterium]